LVPLPNTGRATNGFGDSRVEFNLENLQNDQVSPYIIKDENLINVQQYQTIKSYHSGHTTNIGDFRGEIKQSKEGNGILVSPKGANLMDSLDSKSTALIKNFINSRNSHQLHQTQSK
jgi:hypothetical protein